MSATLLLLLSVITSRGFGPNVRIDHQFLPNHGCHWCEITIGPGAPSSQPLYVVFEDDSTRGPTIIRTDIMFQKSTDAGRTWLPTDVLIRRGAPCGESPDITTDSDGNVYIVYENVYRDTAGAYDHQVLCTRSSDGGATWSSPARIDDDSVRYVGMTSIAADSAGDLFCAWTDWRTGYSHIWSSVSTDRGVTWSRNVRVDDDTTDYDCAHAEVFVQPGTNHYLVAAQVPREFEEVPYVRMCAFLYRSTDRGLTFGPGVQLDTFNRYAGHPHVVADRDHIICDYFGNGREVRDTIIAEARTFYTQADSWGSPVAVTNLDFLHELYYSGTLAISGDGRVHTALMVSDTAHGYNICYASSSNHGVTWSNLEVVNDDTARLGRWYPEIVADSAGHVYVVWTADGKIWFSTNSPLPGIAAEMSNAELRAANNSPTVVRNVLFLPKMGTVPSGTVPISGPWLIDIGGRKVMDLQPGENDVRALAPGVYFMRQASSVEHQASNVSKVVVTR
ncbi:hypothetical protein FJY68_03775 [candidate division WOR-3 bacterium]|uniref:Sialidase domain-containing protein n=1 Tax=candidate division WOR-3 bacterium TaxID=2052148 RepID=A0A937XH38_UNCW3|nr:hypothetical protein [candidate division WOR-3 bacterium]